MFFPTIPDVVCVNRTFPFGSSLAGRDGVFFSHHYPSTEAVVPIFIQVSSWLSLLSCRATNTKTLSGQSLVHVLRANLSFSVIYQLLLASFCFCFPPVFAYLIFRDYPFLSCHFSNTLRNMLLIFFSHP